MGVDDPELPAYRARGNTPIQGTPAPLLMPERSEGVNIARVRVPLIMTLTLIVVCCGAVLSFAFAWSTATSHAANRAIHADEAQSLAKGGVAYSSDVRSAIATEGERTRRLIRAITINCAKRGTEFNCTVSLPELPP